MSKKKVLILSAGRESFKEYFPASRFEKPVVVSSAAAAKQRLSQESFHIAAVVAPLTDEFGLQTANEIAALHHLYVLLAVPVESVDQASYQCRDYNVFVISSPLNKAFAHQALGLLEKVSEQTRNLEKQVAKAKATLQDERLISRCKLKLIEDYHWSEEKAHSYLGKTAMDHSLSKVQVARLLLNRMEARAADR